MVRQLATALMTFFIANLAVADNPAADGQWRGTAAAWLALTLGNTNSQALLLNLDMARITPETKISFSAYANEARSKSNGVTSTTASKLGGAGRYDFNLTESTFGFGGLAFDHDGLLDLNLRTLVTGGLGYRIVKTKANDFNVFGGLSFNNSRYSKPQIIDGKTGDSFSTFGLVIGEDSSHHLTDNTLLKQRLEYYPGLSGDRAQLVKFSSTLSVSMTKTLALNVGIIDTYNSKVGAGKKNNDFSLFTGVSLKLGS
jgi:putative salt-induced outer membrane protein